jgi:hypothetical protein
LLRRFGWAICFRVLFVRFGKRRNPILFLARGAVTRRQTAAILARFLFLRRSLRPRQLSPSPIFCRIYFFVANSRHSSASVHRDCAVGAKKGWHPLKKQSKVNYNSQYSLTIFFGF